MKEPETEAGKRLLTYLFESSVDDLGLTEDDPQPWATALAAIEEQAAQKARDEAVARVRVEFVKALTVDGPTRDRRRKEFNQAIFNAEEGWQVFNGTDLSMVMEKFDRAIEAIRGGAE